MTTLVVIAKECVPGAVKTRLATAFGTVGAARLAAASLDDTLELADRLAASARVLFFDGQAPRRSGWDVVPQPAGSLGDRLAWLFDRLGDPAIVIGMDTPQAEASDFGTAFDEAVAPADAWYGPAADGGFWALGLRRPTGGVFDGVPMSTPHTGERQLTALHRARLRVELLPALRDVDLPDDAAHVAASAPDSRFAHELTRQLARSRRASPKGWR